MTLHNNELRINVVIDEIVYLHNLLMWLFIQYLFHTYESNVEYFGASWIPWLDIKHWT